MKRFTQGQNRNYLAIEMLELCGNSNPTQRQITVMERLLSTVAMTQHITFDHQLTEQEINCLFLAAKGHSIKETATFLQIQCSTVETHRKQILRKLACTSMTQAVFEGIRYGAVPSRWNSCSRLHPNLQREKKKIHAEH